ncbi:MULTISPECIES: hypothetical protein [unclassified Bartonella]|uniref:hypothetical protein n=1 Tax=unclassified Bartonella TaxID=2645622 RepID=UPI0035CF90EE
MIGGILVIGGLLGWFGGGWFWVVIGDWRVVGLGGSDWRERVHAASFLFYG